MIQQLTRTRTPPDWHPGAFLPLRSLWFGLGAPLLSALWLPGSAWRIWLLRAFGAQIGSAAASSPACVSSSPGACRWAGPAGWRKTPRSPPAPCPPAPSCGAIRRWWLGSGKRPVPPQRSWLALACGNLAAIAASVAAAEILLQIQHGIVHSLPPIALPLAIQSLGFWLERAARPCRLLLAALQQPIHHCSRIVAGLRDNFHCQKSIHPVPYSARP